MANIKAPMNNASLLTTGTLDGDRLPAISTTKKGAVPATGTATNKYLRDDGSFAAIAESEVTNLVTDLEAKAPTATPTFIGQATIPTIDLTGGWIKFPATQAASSDVNTLDDYEEGTWTPGVSFGGGTTGITYSAQAGYYTKIGNVVICTGYVLLSSKGTDTGTFLFTGLPFTVANNNAAYSTSAPWFHRISYSGALVVGLVKNAAKMAVGQTTEGGTYAALTDANCLGANCSCVVCAVYRVA